MKRLEPVYVSCSYPVFTHFHGFVGGSNPKCLDGWISLFAEAKDLRVHRQHLGQFGEDGWADQAFDGPDAEKESGKCRKCH